MEHPAKVFGGWLKAKRQEARIVMRVFAGQIELSPAQYAEVEADIVHWLQQAQEELIPVVLCLPLEDTDEFHALLSGARQAAPLRLDDVFTREQLAPLRTRQNDGQLTEEARASIVDAVFTPLS